MGPLNASPIVTATVDKTKMGIQDYLIYQVTFSNVNQQEGVEAQIPNLKGSFEVLSSGQSSAYSMVNGVMSSAETYRYTLAPSKAGVLNIGPASIKVGGKLYKSAGFQITVLATGGKKGSAASGHGGEMLYATASSSKTTVFVGEPFVYKARLFRRVQLWSGIGIDAGDFSGFWTEDLPLAEGEAQQQVQGQSYASKELLSKTLTPIQSGRLRIKGSKLVCVINPFEGKKVFQIPDLVITVLPFPEKGKPQSFMGAVGEYYLSSSLSKKEANQDEPITLKVTVSGKGNLQRIEDLFVPSSNLIKLFKAGSKETKKPGNVLEKIFEYTVVPRSSGSLEIPVLSFSYFNPQKKVYVELKTEPMILNVQAGSGNTKGPVQSPNQSLDRQDIAAITSVPKKASGFSSLFLGLCFLLNTVFLLWMLYKKWGNSLLRSLNQQWKKAHPKEEAKKRILEIKNRYAQHPRDLMQLKDILLGLLSQKAGVSLKSRSWAESENLLQDLYNPVLLQSIRRFFDAIDMLGYAPDMVNRSSADSLFIECDHLVSAIYS